MTLEELDLERHGDVDAAIVAYPHGAAAPVVGGLRERGVKVVDLSADFRLRDRGDLRAVVRAARRRPQLIGTAAYGLTELHREQIARRRPRRQPRLLSDRGAARARAAGARRARSPTWSSTPRPASAAPAARRPTTTHFVSVAENVTPYKVGAHRHTPEIEQELAALGAPVPATFVPHLVPLDQGELTSCYVTTHAARREPSGSTTLYGEAYAGEPFVDVVAEPPGMRDVRETNRCRISVHAEERTGRVIAFAAIDNLWKGTSSQAIQNLNLMFGHPEAEGLDRERERSRRRHERPGSVRRLQLALGAAARARARGRAGHASGGLPRGRGRGGHQALGRPRRRPAGLRRAGDDERRALHALGHAGRAGAGDARALPPRRAARRGRQQRQRQRRDRLARASRRRRGCRARPRSPPAWPRTRSPSARPA